MASVPFNNLITFSRGSNATLTGPDGLIQWAPNNLLTFSEQFDNAAWSKVNATITANTIAAPDGTTTADRLVNTGLWGLDQAATLVAGIRYVISVWVKSGGTGKDTFILYGDGTQASGTLTATSSWVRVEHSFVATVSGARGNGIFRDSSNNPVDIYLWGAQLELGSAATTYNSTTVKNLLGFSEAFDNAAWNKANASIVTGAQANPVNGAFNAQKLMENATGSTDHTAYTNAITAIVGTTYVISFYAKAAGRNWAAVGNFDSSWRRAYFDLVNGVVGTVDAGITAQIVSVGSGWYRCSVTRVMASTSIFAGVWTASANGTITYTGDGNSGVYIYGAQLSDSASLDPYVPTPAAAPSSTAYYGPRFDYDPVTLAPKGLLVEEARTNLLTYSAQFDNASWFKSAGSVTANATTSPDGTANADTFTEDTSTGTHIIRFQPFTVTSGTTYTAAVYVKANGRNRVRLINFDGVTSFVSIFNLSTGTVESGTGTIISVGNGWYRIAQTFASGSTVATNFAYQISLDDGTTNNYTGNGTSGIYIYGAQLEAGAFATSYIPTVASTVTRSADVATINGSLFSQWYGRSEGTFVAGFDMAGGSAAFANNRAVLVARESATSSHNIYNGSGQVTGWTVVSGVDQAFLTTGALAADTVTNMAYAYKANDFAASRNGGTVATDTSGTLPSPTVLGICSNSANSLFLSGHIRSIDYIPARAADFQLQALTL